MSSPRRKNRKGGDARHVRLYTFMTRTPAWKSLSGNERATYLLLAERYMGLNNGKIPYSVREVAAELQISLMTASRCLERLQQRGFIVAMVKGAFSWKTRHATEWRLTEHVCNVSGHGPSGEYRDWRPGPKNQNTVSVVVLNGICGGTDVAQKTRDGICGGTVNGQKCDPQYHQGNTLSYQVPPGKLPDLMTEGSGKAGERSAPIRSAVASEPAATSKQVAGKKPTDLTLAEINAAWRGSPSLASQRKVRPDLMTEYAGTGTRRYTLSTDPRAYQQYATTTPSSLRLPMTTRKPIIVAT
jgi:hypothetical protein